MMEKEKEEQRHSHDPRVRFWNEVGKKGENEKKEIENKTILFEQFSRLFNGKMKENQKTGLHDVINEKTHHQTDFNEMVQKMMRVLNTCGVIFTSWHS